MIIVVFAENENQSPDTQKNRAQFGTQNTSNDTNDT